MLSTDQAWDHWGRIDPYFAVASGPDFRAGALDHNRAAFFRDGEAYVDGRLEKAKQHFAFEPSGTALDFGCGVGRLAIPLARRFSSVVGVDIADSMLAEAKKNARDLGVENLSFSRSEGLESIPEQSLQFVNSYIVLQHIPVRRGMAYIDQLLSLVAPGGVAALHFSVSRQMGPLRNGLYLAKKCVPGALALVNLMRRRRYDEPLMQMNEYNILESLKIFERNGFSDVQIEFENHFGVLTALALAQKN